jgi:hypothetical protein
MYSQIPAQGVLTGTLKSHYIQFYPRNVPLEHLPNSYGENTSRAPTLNPWPVFSPDIPKQAV